MIEIATSFVGGIWVVFTIYQIVCDIKGETE